MNSGRKKRFCYTCSKKYDKNILEDENLRCTHPIMKIKRKKEKEKENVEKKKNTEENFKIFFD